MLVKSATVEHHVKDLAKILATLRAHKMMLNPAKCTFDVEAGKFLRFMVLQRGPENIKAILDIAPPQKIQRKFND